VFKIDSLMTLDIDKEILVFEVAVSTVLDHMKSGNTVVLGSINLGLLVTSLFRVIN
jgi:hypothetical protein